MLSMGMQMEWCCVHFAGGDGCLYGDEGGDEDSRAAEDNEDVEDKEDTFDAASVFGSLEYS